jgi:glycosyltransferase involved in cell wall biosynthesis
MGASNMQQAKDLFASHAHLPPNPALVPFGAQGKPQGLRFWHVHDFAYPTVSIIVTCGPGHKHLLIDALDSIQAQSYPDWECVVVNDTGTEWPADIMGAPFAKVINMDGNRGASAARNEGLKYTKGKYVVWLDADDYWFPWFLNTMVGYAEYNDGVIYSDFIEQMSQKEFKIYHYADDFDPRALKHGCALPGTSILIPRKVADAIPWDTEIVGLEDYEWQLAVCHAGFCFFHVKEPLFVYRLYSSTKREKDFARREEVQQYINKKYDDEAWKKIVS